MLRSGNNCTVKLYSFKKEDISSRGGEGNRLEEEEKKVGRKEKLNTRKITVSLTKVALNKIVTRNEKNQVFSKRSFNFDILLENFN